MLSQAEIAELLPAVAKGDRDAFQRLYGATCAKVYGVVLRILRRHDLATNVMEDAYQQVWNTAGQFDAAHWSPVAWMVAIARARAIDLARLPETTASDAEPEIADAEAPGAMPRREMTEDLKRLLTCIGRLEPERQRMVLLAYYGAFTRGPTRPGRPATEIHRFIVSTLEYGLLIRQKFRQVRDHLVTAALIPRLWNVAQVRRKSARRVRGGQEASARSN